MNNKKLLIRMNAWLMIIPAVLGIIILLNGTRAGAASFDVRQKRISLSDNGFSSDVLSDAATVQDFLDEQKIIVNKNDIVFPEKSAKMFAGTHVTIWRAKKIMVKEGENTEQFYVVGRTVEQALWENNDIDLGEDDITSPSRQAFVKEGMTVTVTHVLIKEETKKENIDYKTISHEDDSLGWRTKKVTQAGAKGLREVRYRVVYHDGKEISRKIVETDVIKEPVTEEVIRGTYVKLGKLHTGLGTWYDQGPHPKLRARYPFEGDMFAANPWLPLGSYVKVTNKANGKSVIVRINDRGPFGENRIIDLNKPAFALIGSLYTDGVLDVKIEEITN